MAGLGDQHRKQRSDSSSVSATRAQSTLCQAHHSPTPHRNLFPSRCSSRVTSLRCSHEASRSSYLSSLLHLRTTRSLLYRSQHQLRRLTSIPSNMGHRLLPAGPQTYSLLHPQGLLWSLGAQQIEGTGQEERERRKGGKDAFK